MLQSLAIIRVISNIRSIDSSKLLFKRLSQQNVSNNHTF